MNKWITFVKEWAKKHKVDYRTALMSPVMKADYNKMKK